MNDDDRAQLDRALATIASDYGVDLLEQPRKAIGLVADLIAEPAVDRTAEFIAFRSATRQLASQGVRRGASLPFDQIVRSCVDEGVTPADARAAVEVIAHRTGLDDASGTAGGSSPGTNWRLILVVAAVAVAVAGAVFVLLSDDPGPPSTEASTPSGAVEATTVPEEVSTVPIDSGPESTTSSAATTSPAVVEEVNASFQAVREGPFEIERGWRVPPDRDTIVGVVRIRGVDGLAATGLHRELIPPLALDGDFASIEWTPQPVQRVNAVGVFDIALEAGELVVIEYRAPLRPGGSVDETEVLVWYDDWAPKQDQQRPLGDSDDLLAPLVDIG